MNLQSATSNSCINNLATGNQTLQSEFILVGLSDLTYSRIPLVVLFFFIYLLIVAVNLFIIVLVFTDSHLQSPMYFFLGNLSIIDIVTPSLPALHLPSDLFPGRKLILYSTCVTHVFLYVWFFCTEGILLAYMSIDRYVAICHPLHYSTIISIKLCVRVMVVNWIFSAFFSLMHTLCLLRLSYFSSVTIQSLFCELYQLIQLSCSDTYLNNLLISLSGVWGVVNIVLINLISYIYIFKNIMKIKMKDGRQKAFSTCTSHLSVVFIFYGTGLFNYTPSNAKHVNSGMIQSILYTFLTSFLNPVIYSLRNKELRSAVQRNMVRVGYRS